MTCRNCGSGRTRQELITTGKHYGKEVCVDCGGWVRWLPKPKNQNTRRKTSKYTPEKLGVDCCEMCRRTRPQLANNQTLEVHHKDHDYENDIPTNLIVLCTFCHKHVHMTALYLNFHYQEIPS